MIYPEWVVTQLTLTRPEDSLHVREAQKESQVAADMCISHRSAFGLAFSQ